MNTHLSKSITFYLNCWQMWKYPSKLKVGHAVDASFCLLLLYFDFLLHTRRNVFITKCTINSNYMNFSTRFYECKRFFFLMLSWTSVQHFYSTKLKEKLQRWKKKQRLFLAMKEKNL